MPTLWSVKDYILQLCAMLFYSCATYVVFALALWGFRYHIADIPLVRSAARDLLPCEVYTRTQLGDVYGYDSLSSQVEYVDNTRFTNAIEKAVLDAVPRVWLLYAPFSAGKSTVATHVLRSLRRQGKVNVLQLNGICFAKYLSHRDSVEARKNLVLLDWLQHAMGCAKPFSSSDIGDIFPEKHEPNQPFPVLFIDQFECLTNEESPDVSRLKTMMHKVATDVAARKNFAALVITSDLEAYKDMLTWDAGEPTGKIFTEVVEGGFFWTQEEMLNVANTWQRKGLFSLTTATPAAVAAAMQEEMRKMTSIIELRDYLHDHENVLVDFSRAATPAAPEPDEPSTARSTLPSPCRFGVYVYVFFFLNNSSISAFF